MRISTLFYLLLICTIFPWGVNAQNTPVTLNLVNVPLNDVLNEIEKQSDYTFLVNQDIVETGRKVTAVFTNTSIKDVLEALFKDTDVKFVISGRQIILSTKKATPNDNATQNKVITGWVTDEKNHEPLAGVTVQIKGTTRGTLTNNEGYFSVELLPEDTALVFSSIGFESQELATNELSQPNIVLHETAIELESIVVTALGIKREKKALGYSVQNIDGEALQTIKTSDATTSLTGKISGLLIKNSSNFGTAPDILLRGEEPLIVVDGVPSSNIKINDISQDDIQSIDVLKGATASALYGYRGANGAIMITTKRGGNGKGMSVAVNTSTMFNLGFVVKPEVQSSYSSGYNGKYGDDYIWGDKLDIGRTATLWDPFQKKWVENTPLVSKGKNNLKNFQELGYISNNNISLTNQGENSNLRASISYVYNKGQFPNQKLTKITYSLGGDVKFKNLTLESNISYSKHTSPNIYGNQYSGGYLYNLIGWLGAEWDIRDYKDYWLVKDQSQNWFNEEWYDNPYFLANEVLKTADRDIINGFVSATYKFNSWAKLSFRTGLDSYLDRNIYRNPISARNAFSYYGYYEDHKNSGYSTNNDLILSLDKSFNKFRIEGLMGGTLFYSKDDVFYAYTEGGLSIPGFYSLRASVDPIGWDTSLKRRQVNSLYSRMALSWDNLAFIDFTGRNDWSSTLSKDNRSYFYPSVAGSLIVSELLPKMAWLDMWKLRSSWTISKTPAGIYDILNAYEISNEVWGGYNSASYPDKLRSTDLRPQTAQTLELGTAGNFLNNRLRVDVTMFRMRIYDYLASDPQSGESGAPISDASGFISKYVNSDEERVKKGIEVMLGITPVKSSNWKWNVNFNWSKDATFYSKLDPQYSPNELWIKKGARVDAYTTSDWMKDSHGNLINVNGFPVRSDFSSVVGYSNPDWIWGLNSDIHYKNLTFSFSFDGRMGGVSFSRLDALLWNSGAHKGTDTKWRYDEVVNGLKNYVGPGVKVVSGSVTFDSYGRITSDDRVFAPNDAEVSYESYMKDNYHRGAWSYCSQDVLDETFIKLREVAVSYIMPKALAEKIRMKDMVISIVGQNLFFWGKEFKISDADYGSSWDLVSPSIRYAGFNIKFNL